MLKAIAFDIIQGIEELIHQIEKLKEDIEEVKKRQNKTETRLNKINKLEKVKKIKHKNISRINIRLFSSHICLSRAYPKPIFN
jgi:cell fate (sporulation/competence/biofilm development) regulator YmcA (YheA/YmcA/DUF963 family)